MTPPAMPPETFRHSVDSALCGAPPAPPVAEELAAGQSLLRRRRRAVGGGLLVAVVLLAGSAYAAVGLPDSSQQGPMVTDLPVHRLGDAALTRACHDQWRSDTNPETRDGFWESGRPRMMARDRLGAHTVAVLESADGTMWARCKVMQRPTPEFSTSLQVYDNSTRSRSFGYGTSPACLTEAGAIEPDCDSFLLDVAIHLPDAVAEVELRMADGDEIRVPTHEGYLAVVHQFSLPGGVDRMEFSPLARVTYLDRNGEALAAQAMDGSGEGPDGEGVGDLPRLRAFPGYGVQAL